MGNEVFANGREVSCKAADGKSICAFPDVCFTPPQTPATPPGVPIPYPNTGFAKDTTKGSKSVKITNKEVMLKNKSYFKTSTGDEAGCAPKKGVMTSKIKGKIYFTAWSMDVKFEGKNVVRHLDLTTHNHSSQPGQTPPWPYADSMAIENGKTDDPCARDKKKEEEACANYTPYGTEDACVVAGLADPNDPMDTIKPNTHSKAKKMIDDRKKSAANDCINARRCRLQPYSKAKKGKGGCCPAQTGNHVIPASYFDGISEYKYNDAPTMCVIGSSWHSGNHQYLHTGQSILDDFYKDSKGTVSVQQAARNGGQVQKEVFKEQGCDEKCIEAQVITGHKDMGIDKNTRIKHVPIAEKEKYVDRLMEVLERNVIP